MITRKGTRSASTAMTNSVEIIHDLVGLRFIARRAAKELGCLEYSLSARYDNLTVVDFYHTQTVPEARGKGIAAKLVIQGFEWAREKNFSVIPSCSYVSFFLEKHPEWKSLL